MRVDLFWSRLDPYLGKAFKEDNKEKSMSGTKSKAKALAVDKALVAIQGSHKDITLTAEFFRKWDEAVRDLGGSLSAERIRRAVEKLGYKIKAILSCATQFMSSRGWVIDFA